MGIEYEDSLSNETPTENVPNTDSTPSEILSSEEKQSPFMEFVTRCADRLDKKMDSVIDKMEDPERTLKALSEVSKGVGYFLNSAVIVGTVLNRQHGVDTSSVAVIGGVTASVPFHFLSSYFKLRMENLDTSSESVAHGGE
mgnify:CR=1 FL=1